MISSFNRIVDMLCPGCSNWQSATVSDGWNAADPNWLFGVFIITCGFNWQLCMVVLLVALLRRVSAEVRPLVQRGERPAAIILGAAVFGMALIIAVLAVLSYAATSGIASSVGEPMVIRARSSMVEAIYLRRSRSRTGIL